ncbi:MAG: dockerin type I repeat-containing protein, partial [Bacteroidota bacterium]
GMEAALYQGADLNFQVRLYETTGVIEFVYETMTGFFGYFTPGTLPTFTYSLGINSWTMSATPTADQLISQQVHNTRSFSASKKDNLGTVPACNSMIQFVPGTYTAYVPPASSAPANDLFANAVTMSVGTEPCTNLCGGVFSSANATATSGVNAGSGMGPADDDVWFKFTATKATVSIRAFGSSQYDPSIEVFNTSTTPTTTNRFSGTNATSQGFTETANLTGLIVGNTYLFRVFHGNSLWGQSGDFAVCVYETPSAAVNDNCAGAINLTIGATCTGTSGSSIAGSLTTGIDSCNLALKNPDDDVWYKFTAVASKETIRVTGGHKYDPVIQAFSGACGSLVALSCADQSKNAQSETISLTGLTVGNTYFVRVYQTSFGAGRGAFSICITAPVPSCVTTQIPGNGTTNVPFGGTNLAWSRVPDATAYDVYMDTISPPVNMVATNHPDTFIFSGTLKKGYTYYYRINPKSVVGTATGCFTSVFAAEPFGYNMIVKAFLETFYKGNQKMVTTINPNDSICDTITVKLYDNISPYALQYSVKALLDTNGVAYAEFPQPALQRTYYIAVEHRNHLETWSSVPFAFDSPDTTYDFTASPTSAFGSNLKLLGPGVYGIYGGDVNQDDAINISDMNALANRASLFGTIYRQEDITGDGVVESADYSLIESLIFNSIILRRP